MERKLVAKSAKEGARSDGVIKTIPGSALKQLIKDATAAKTAAAEASGEHGALVKNACERYNIERNAFSWTRKLNEMEGAKRIAVVRQLIDFCGKLGHFDQVDAFDDIVPMLEQLLSDLKGRQPAPPSKQAADLASERAKRKAETKETKEDAKVGGSDFLQ